MSLPWNASDLKGLRWPGNARIAVLVNVEYEPTRPIPPLGDGVRDLRAMSTYEYEARCGIWRVLGILDKFGVPATFFVSGATAAGYQDSVREIKKRGHEVAAHGWEGGEKWWQLNEQDERKALEKVVAAITDATGEAPLGWLSPRANPSENTLKLLGEMNFVHHSDFFDAELPYVIDIGGKKIVEMARTNMTDDTGKLDIGSLFETYRDEFDYLYAESETAPRLFMTTWHVWVTPRPPRAKAMEDLLRHIKEHTGVWFARFIDVAQLCLRSP
ncbi:MAG: polysaccharide deacetylase family protein [Chloroflexi bacterium]|nr:polysaccharide deacetylase family protein [Chloroflexota bacterium]